MSLVSAVAIYFIIWWVTLFAVLPFGVRSQAEDGRIVPGSEKGAPTAPLMLKKALWTTVVASVIFGVYYINYVFGLITLDDIPFIPRYSNV